MFPIWSHTDMSKTYSFKEKDPQNKRKSRQTRAATSQTKDLKVSLDRIASDERALELKTTRDAPSIAKGLTSYRKMTGLPRTKFAKEFGVTRRALFNYEKGNRAVPGDLLECIVARGDVELSDILGLPPEPPTRTLRIADAKLAIDVFEAFRAKYPEVVDEDVKFFIAFEVARWPMTFKRTPKAMERVATKIMRSIGDHYRQTGAYLDQL
ncbi:hypothetical protein A8B78_08070 [Jannaschia sp. EhC01]|nr:hypothetical protein A8B78_08070 [Jannaschia sp. EhC01]